MTTEKSGKPIAVMKQMIQKKSFFGTSEKEDWETFEESQAMDVFRRAFLAFPHKMIVIEPDFSRFDAQYNQCFVYGPMDGAAQKQNRKRLEFLRHCLDKIQPANAQPDEAAEIAFIEGKYIKEQGFDIPIDWSVPEDTLLSSVKILSKKTCYHRIAAPLAAHIGRDEGGIYAPYGGEGIFFLMSV